MRLLLRFPRQAERASWVIVYSVQPVCAKQCATVWREQKKLQNFVLQTRRMSFKSHCGVVVVVFPMLTVPPSPLRFTPLGSLPLREQKRRERRNPSMWVFPPPNIHAITYPPVLQLCFFYSFSFCSCSAFIYSPSPPSLPHLFSRSVKSLRDLACLSSPGLTAERSRVFLCSLFRHLKWKVTEKHLECGAVRSATAWRKKVLEYGSSLCVFMGNL